MNHKSEKISALYSLIEQPHLPKVSGAYYHAEIPIPKNLKIPVFKQNSKWVRKTNFVQGLGRLGAKLLRIAQAGNYAFSERLYKYEYIAWNTKPYYQVSLQAGKIILEKLYYANK